MPKNKKTTIVLDEGDVALVFKEDGEMKFYFDEKSEEDNAGTIILGSIILMLGEGDPELTKIIAKRYKKLVCSAKEQKKVVKRKTKKKST